MSPSRRSSSEQVCNQDDTTPTTYFLSPISRSFHPSNQLRRLDVDAQDRQDSNNHETQPTLPRNVSDIDIMDMDIDYTLYEELQAADLIQYNMNFQI